MRVCASGFFGITVLQRSAYRRRATNGETRSSVGSGERAAASSSSVTWGWTATSSFLLHRGEHLFQPLDEERRRFHDARLLRLHQRARLLEILLPVGVGLHRRAAFLALVEAVVGPQVHHHVQSAGLGEVVAHHVRKVPQLHVHAELFVDLAVLRDGADLQAVHALFDVHAGLLRKEVNRGGRDYSIRPMDDINTLRRILKQSHVIAVVGLSADWYRPSYFAAKYMQEHGYHVIPVNPKYQSILGEKCYPSLRDIPEKVDIVDVFRKSEDVMPIAEDAIAIRAKVLWQQLGVKNEAAAAKARAGGLEAVLDHCVKIEHGRLFGGLNWVGVNTKVISAKRPRWLAY